MDLIKYSSERLDYSTTYTHNTPNYNTFITLLTNLFHQPFGSMNVTCETLHDEYCRVRLVTEVLEIIVAGATLGPVASTTLSNARTNYLMMVYKSLLRQAGTSIEELRNIVSITDTQAKIDSTKKWAEKLGITFEVPSSSVLTSDRLWLTFGAGSSGQVLNATNLEDLFGFRNTTDSQIVPTLPAQLLDWKKQYLKNIWNAQDYTLTSYSRENATATSTPPINWKPIIDPDIIGTSDMPYNLYEPAVKLWKNRKADTDKFLNYYHGNSVVNDVLSRTSADIKNRQVKVTGRNLLIQQLDNNEVEIQNSSSTWVTFTVFSKSLSKTDTILSLSKPTPAIFQPNGTTPKMRYKRVLAVPVGQTLAANSFTITWPTEVISDVLSGGYARLESSGSSTTYATSGGTNSLSVSYPSGNDKATVTLGGAAPNLPFINGNVLFVYEVEVNLFTTEIPDPEKVATKLFNKTETYTPIAPAYASAFTYNVFTTPSIAPWDSGISEYANLKNIYVSLKNNTASNGDYTIISDYLHTNTDVFCRMMELLELCEFFLSATFNSVKPTEDELYEMASIFRSCAKPLFRDYWIKEELRYSLTIGGPAILLKLSKQFFWKAITEPQTGPWDPRLQTIPDTVGAINSTNVPIIDPELLTKSEMLQYPANQAYLDLYDARALVLSNQLKGFYIYWIPAFGINLFEKILNYIDNNNNTIPYNISPYADLEDLLVKIQSNDAFTQADAVSMAWDAFRLNKDEFIAMMVVKTGYESADPSLQPTATELDKGLKLLTSAYKRKQIYFATTTGWIEEEVSGSFTGGGGTLLHYYDVLPMKLGNGRSDANDRSEWQKTLELWNRQPFVNPDIVPPEYIKDFTTGNYAHDNWVIRKNTEDTLYTNLLNIFTTLLSPNTNANLLVKYEQQIDLLIARDASLTPISGTPYLKYFTEISSKEIAGEDITIILDQLGFSVPEYRYLRKIFDYISQANPVAAPNLLTEEYEDVVNIMLQIRKRNSSFTYVTDEYDNGIILSEEYFVLFKPQQINFPQNTLPVVNPWRFSITEQKDWKDTLEGRIERKESVLEKWKDSLIAVEDDCMPYLRDAIIEALRNSCETFSDAADRLAKTYFIETKDNCCVKHTRVSFAIETIQGLLFALQNGVYDEYATGFKLFAPHISKEWRWIGSYATWRSAVFVFVYPENMLYPTLKRLQSPKFQELTDKLQNATKFTPQDACDAAKDYTVYFNDIQNLELICSTNVYGKLINDDPNECCDDSSMVTSEITYFFGKSYESGNSYWSFKSGKDNSAESHSFWELLPIRQGAEPIGCFVFKDTNEKGTVIGSSLWMFFTYQDNGKLSLGYLTRNISKANAVWKEEKANDLPNFKEFTYEYQPIYVTACQQSSDTMEPSFFIGYRSHQFGIYTCHVLLSRDSKKFTPDKFDHANCSTTPNAVNGEMVRIVNWENKPVGAVKFNSAPGTVVCDKTLAIAFEKKVVFLAYGDATITTASLPFDQVLGIYELNGNNGQLLIFFYDNLSQFHMACFVTVAFNGGASPSITITHNTIQQTNLSPELQWGYRIRSVFSPDTDYERFFAIGSNLNAGGYLGATIDVDLDTSTLTMTSNNIFMLTPAGGYTDGVTSSECIADLKARKLAVQQHMEANTNIPIGSVSSYFLCTTKQLEYLIEAYYFVPMLLALDQQQRGQYEAALTWYRTVYDYTESLVTNRKIFYGLIVEENIANTYSYASGWLIDPLNPHLIAKTRANSYTKYTLMNIIQCLFGYADRQFTLDTIETVPQARKLYSVGLDLLKVKELNLKPNACIDISSACLSSGTVINSDPSWKNMFEKLQGLLNSYANPTTVQTRVNYVLSIFNGSGALADKFTAAFDYLYANPPVPGSSNNVITLLDGLADRMNDTYRYALAFNNSQVYYQAVSASYQGAVAQVSGISPALVNSPSSVGQISWLTESSPQNNAVYSGSFANSSGIQNLSGNSAFNPLQPNVDSYEANVAYSNASNFVSYQSQNQLPYTYIPLIDYYFCLPSNPIYSGLVLKGNLELYKIFNCRNIAGMVRELDPYAAATDSTTGVPVIGAGGTLNIPGNVVFSPSQYRFKSLIERAKQLVGQSQQLESLFLAAMEKVDAENYSQLQAKQGLATAKATVVLQNQRITQAVDEKGVAALQRDKAIFMQTHFNTLLAKGNNWFENNSIDHLTKTIDYMNASIVFQTISAILNATAGVANVTTIWQDAGGSYTSFAQAAGAVAGALSTNASIESTRSQIDSMLGSFERRNEEWQFQEELAGKDIEISKQQIQVADDNVRIVTQEREIAQMNVDHAQETLEFFQNKFTNAALYNWMSGVLERSYSYMLNISTAVARTAERQLFFERQEQSGPFILNDYWETPTSGAPGGSTNRRGLTGSARLLVDITKLEQHALDTYKRKLQMTKVISLSTNFPAEFQQFRETGVMNFQLTNKQFDYDFPGHYLRLINDVKTTVVGLVPVYDGIKATLTADTISYTVIGGNVFQKMPIKRMELDSVALTSTTNASGLFEMQPMAGELLNPFEGMGVESRWEFKLPQFTNRFDFNNIADVLITVNYTAIDSYLYRYQILQELDNKLTFNRAFSFRNDFPDQWFELSEAEAGNTPFGVIFEFKRDMFPQGVVDLKLNKSTNILFYFVRKDGYVKEISLLDLSLYTAQSGTNYSGGDTIDGKFDASQLMNTLGSSPVMKLRLLFANLIENRKMFSDGSIQDILVIVPCKAELKSYPI
jgi:hypothetical protein